MSKKHFIALAEAISRIENADERKRTAELVGTVCEECNGRFDWSRWLRACNVEGF